MLGEWSVYSIHCAYDNANGNWIYNEMPWSFVCLHVSVFSIVVLEFRLCKPNRPKKTRKMREMKWNTRNFESIQFIAHFSFHFTRPHSIRDEWRSAHDHEWSGDFNAISKKTEWSQWKSSFNLVNLVFDDQLFAMFIVMFTTYSIHFHTHQPKLTSGIEFDVNSFERGNYCAIINLRSENIAQKNFVQMSELVTYVEWSICKIYLRL